MLVADNQLPFLFLPKPHTPGLMSSVPRMRSWFPLPPSSLPHSKVPRIWENKGEKTIANSWGGGPLWEKQQRKAEGGVLERDAATAGYLLPPSPPQPCHIPTKQVLSCSRGRYMLVGRGRGSTQ